MDGGCRLEDDRGVIDRRSSSEKVLRSMKDLLQWGINIFGKSERSGWVSLIVWVHRVRFCRFTCIRIHLW